MDAEEVREARLIAVVGSKHMRRREARELKAIITEGRLAVRFLQRCHQKSPGGTMLKRWWRGEVEDCRERLRNYKRALRIIQRGPRGLGWG